MIALLFICAFALVSSGLGLGIVSLLDKNRILTGVERLATGFGLGGGLLYYGVFAIGPYRLDRASMGVLALVAAGAALPGFRVAMGTAAPRDLVHRVVARMREDKIFAVVLIAASAIGLSSLMQGMAPPNDYDSLLYHLSIPQLDVERGWIEPAWNRGLPHVLFPALMHHLYRFALVLGGEASVQMIHGMYGLVAAIATGSLVLRLGFSALVAAIAAAFFLATRVVIWEMGTPEVDVALSTYTVLALVVYAAAREHRSLGLMILVGILLGAAMNVKHHGIVITACFGIAMLVDVTLKPSRLPGSIVAGAAALLVFVPHLVRTHLLTGNPLFPIFNSTIVPGMRNFFDNTNFIYGTGRGFIDVLLAPWALSVAPMHNFDGMILGSPYLLALAPLALGARRQITPAALPLLVVAVTYYVVWFFGLSQQVRFLLPIMPAMAAFAAIGAAAMWAAVRPQPVLCALFVGSASILALNQALFVGIYAAIRLPVAAGLMSPERYHADTPTLQGAYYRTCSYIRDRLKPGERYLSLIMPHSYYCPQNTAVLQYFEDEERAWLTSSTFPAMSLPEFVDRFEQSRFRYVILATQYENRRNESGKPVDVKFRLDDTRFGPFIMPAAEDLTPLATDRFTAVYDGDQVLERLRNLMRVNSDATTGPKS